MSICAALLAAPLWSAEPLSGTARVVDGDGLRLGGLSIRIAGIDAPERGQLCRTLAGSRFDCGEAMRDLLAKQIEGKTVTCRDTGERSHKRVVAICSIDGHDLGEQLITEGRARAHPTYATERYLRMEQRAKTQARGLWSHEMVAPWDYRRQKRAAHVPNPPPQATQDCPIKGNINSKGARIYHAPGQQHYAKVRISPHKGERCFGTEHAARQAGWRAAKR